MVLNRKLEVRQNNGDCRSDDEQDAEDHEKNGEDCEVLVPPHAHKDVVQLNVDGAERQEAREQHLWHDFPVPRKCRDLARILSGTAWRVKANLHKLNC
jgi:hypothetical protein